ncbi:transposase, MuDR, MULE transposase domain protein [Tanacetum coccineum]
MHTCSKTQILPNHRNANKYLIGKLLTEILRDHKRVYKPKDIQKDFNYNWKIDISYKRAWAGKMAALNMLNGSQKSSFMELPYYFHNLKLANEGTVTHIGTDDEGCFNMCFLAFGVAIRSFTSYMRPLIKIDEAHLKGTYLGTNLLVVGMDANNLIIPLATSVSQGETIETCSWFLNVDEERLREIRNRRIISDRHYSITVTCANVFPNTFHGCCCRHLMMNCKFKSDKLKAWYWKTCKAYIVPEFERSISGIKALRPEAYKKLEDAGFERYTGEDKPAVDELSKWAAAKVKHRMLKSAKWTVKGIDWFRAYEVKDNKTVHIVDLVKRQRSCLKW